jgi:hypothetical protein
MALHAIYSESAARAYAARYGDYPTVVDQAEVQKALDREAERIRKEGPSDGRHRPRKR